MTPDTPTPLFTFPQTPSRLQMLSLGEVMLRFDPADRRISTTRRFDVWEGGGEYNVARGLRRCFGIPTGIVTALVDNGLGRLVEDLILQGGVDTRHIHWHPFDGLGRDLRNGLYFLERGFGVRPGAAVMDRGHTAVARMAPADLDWDELFRAEGVRWFHTGGIMAALSESATDTVRAAMQAARRHGVAVSFDCNYRQSLWKSRGGRQGSVDVNRSLMPYIDVLFGHEGDIARTLGESSHKPVWHTADTFADMAARVVAEFPGLRAIASTVRAPHTATRNDWSAYLFAGDQVYSSRHYLDLEILDRVGAGDGFAAGILYGLLTGKPLQWTLDCGVAHGALVMTTPGDNSTSTLADVERLMTSATANTLR